MDIIKYGIISQVKVKLRAELPPQFLRIFSVGSDSEYNFTLCQVLV